MTPWINSGGGNRVLLQIADSLIPNGFKSIIYYIKIKGEYFDISKHKSVSISSNNNSITNTLRSFFQLSQLIKKNKKVKFVLVSDPICCIFSLAFKNKKIIRYVQADDRNLFNHNIKSNIVVNIIYRLFFKISLKYNYHNIIFNSKFTSDCFKGKNDNNNHLDIINPPAFTHNHKYKKIRELNYNSIQICAVTSTHKRKGLDRLLLIIDKCKKHKNIYFNIISQDELINNQQNQNVNYFKPADSDAYVKILNESHFILSTSTFEGYGLPLLEGMCLGLVPISFFYGGIMEYYDGENINLINNENEFIDIILFYSKNPESFKNHSELAINSTSPFSIKIFSNKILQQFNSNIVKEE